MKPARHLPTALFATTLLGLTGTLSAQSSPQVASDMEFARGLAERFAYVDMAEEVIADLESRGLSGADAEGLALVRCDVYAAGAKGERTTEKRLEMYDKALGAYSAFIEDNAYSDFIPAAQKHFVELTNDYGRILEIVLADQLGAEADAGRQRIKDAIDSGLELIGDLIQETHGAVTKVEKNERYRLMLYKGQMLLTLANVSEDGDYFYSRALQTLEDLALEAGEQSGPGLNAYLLMAKVMLAQGDASGAGDFAAFVYEIVLPTDSEVRDQLSWSEMTFEEKVPRWRLAEVCVDPLIQAYLAQGDAQTASLYALAFYNDQHIEGFDVSDIGNLSMLACATALLEAGGFVGGQVNRGNLRWFESQEEMTAGGFSGSRNTRSALDLALLIAQEVNDGNKGSSLQTRAQRVISDIIGRPGVVVSPDILFEAAQGDYYAEEYARALDSFKGILSQLDARDEATQQEYAPKVLFHMGKSLSKMDRELEAAMAFREAATVWAGDPEYDQQVADGYYKSIGRARTASGGDQLLQNLYLEAENLLKNLDAGGGAIAFRQAERAYVQKDYTQARNLYLQVEEGTADYEKARVKAALCLYKLKDEDGAVAEFEDYLNGYVKDPRTKPVDAKKIRTRQEAMAIATFYLGRIAYAKSDWDAVVSHLTTFAQDFPDQDDYGPNALYMVVKADLNKGDLAEAKRVVGEMSEKFPAHTRTGLAALNLYTSLKGEEEKARTAGDTATADGLKTEMGTYLNLANSLAEKPSFNNLRTESTIWIELAQWEKGEAALRRIVSSFGDDSSQDLTKHILPDLGLVLLEQKKVPDAFQVLDPLIPKSEDDPRKVGSKTVSRWCRSVTGWVEGDGNNVIEVPGVGGAADLGVACSNLRKLTDSEGVSGKYTCPWYGRKFETAYGYYQWGKEDSNQTRNALVLIQDLQNKLDDTRLRGIGDECSDDTLSKRFLWLLTKVK